MINEIATSTNNKYYIYSVHKNNVSKKSEEFDSKIEAIEEFCKNVRNQDDFIWGQCCCHHYADEWQDEKTAVIFILTSEDKNALK